MENNSSQNGNGYNQNGPDYSSSYSNQSQNYQQYVYSPYGNATSRPEQGQTRNFEQVSKKKGGHAGLIIGITAAVLVVAVIVAALAVGCMWVYSSFVRNLNSYEKNAETTALSEHSGIQKTPQDVGQAVLAELNTSDTPSAPQMSLVDAVELVKDSVVEITTELRSSGTSLFSQYITSGAGSGVIISDTGLVITNNHVIDGATKITIRLTNGKEYDATLVGTDEENDVAVLSFDPNGEKLVVAKNGNSDILKLGQQVIVIGNPLGKLGGSVTTGIISCTAREISVENVGVMTLLQTDAAVNPGNSGGAMFNLSGELVGIVNAKYTSTDVEGLGFAIPVNTAWKIATELVKYGYVRGRASLDISYVDVSSSDIFYAYQYFKSTTPGVYVFETNESVGVKYGDRIISINGTEISSSSDISSYLRTCSVGDVVQLSVVRNKKTVTLSVTLIEKIPEKAN